MKFDRYQERPSLWHGCMPAWLLSCLLVCGAAWQPSDCLGQPLPESELNARTLAMRTMERLVYGDAFDATLRQRVWAGGREVVGVGHYEQSGGGTGRYSMEMTIHDGESRQTLKQISDGRLAWSRSEIAGEIAIHRVDLGRIDEFEQELLLSRSSSTFESSNRIARLAGARSGSVADPPIGRVPARLLAGGLAELLDRIQEDYELRLSKGTVEGHPVWILRGTMKEQELQRLKTISAEKAIAPLCPLEVRVAVSATPDANGFGVGLPVRFEFWSAPEAKLPVSPTAKPADEAETKPAVEALTDSATPVAIDAPSGRLISLIEIYAMRKIAPSPEERFRFSSDDREVTFVNDTKHYLDRVAKQVMPSASSVTAPTFR